jgi:hypothetical protein
MPPTTTVEDLAKLQLLYKITKLFQNSINLIVNTTSNSQQKLTKIQDEQAYSVMIEDYCKFALRKKSIYLLKLIPTLMHAGFISHKTYEGICRSFAGLVENRD